MKNSRQLKKGGVRGRKWKVLSSSYVLKTPWLKVKKDKVRLPNGKIIDDFFSVEGNELVALLAVNDSKEVLLVKQYRHAVGQETFDLPGGAVRKNETPIAAAKRELAEETGYSARQLKKMITYYPDSGKKGDVKHIFLAEGLKHISKIANGGEEDEEILSIKWLPLSEIDKGIARGKLKEATLQLAVLYYIRYSLK